MGQFNGYPFYNENPQWNGWNDYDTDRRKDRIRPNFELQCTDLQELSKVTQKALDVKSINGVNQAQDSVVALIDSNGIRLLLYFSMVDGYKVRGAAFLSYAGSTVCVPMFFKLGIQAPWEPPVHEHILNRVRIINAFIWKQRKDFAYFMQGIALRDDYLEYTIRPDLSGDYLRKFTWIVEDLQDEGLVPVPPPGTDYKDL